jgi:hypothetical protein
MSNYFDHENVIRITPTEAGSSHVDDLLKRQGSLRGEGITRDRRGAWFYSNWFLFSLAGLLGTVLAWAIWEPFYNDSAYIQGKIERIGPGEIRVDGPDGKEVVVMPPEMEQLTVGGQKFLLFPGTRPYGDKSPKAKIDRGELKVGREIGAYLEADHAEITVALQIDLNPPAGKKSDDLAVYRKTQRLGGFLLFPTIAALAGLFIGAADGAVCRLWRRVLLAGGVGLLAGFVGCFITSNLANLIYGPLTQLAQKQSSEDGIGGLSTTGFLIQTSVRGVAWALAGMAIGLGQGLALRSSRLLLYGFLGGAIGGLLGGTLFDPIFFMVSGEHATSAHLSRGIGFGVIGLSVGLMIGVVELLARDAWLRMVQGPLSGKEFLVFKDSLVVGASPRSDIYLFNDEEVAERHAVIRAAADQYEIEATDPVRPVLVNNRPVRRQRLRHGDQITLGRTVFVFQRKRGE